MLLQATFIVDLIAMAATLWIAFYLFARGFLNATTLRIVIVLLALSGFFFGAYDNIFVRGPGTAAIRAIYLVIGLTGWYSIAHRVMSEHNQRRFRWVEWSIYLLCVVTIVLLLQPNVFVGGEENALHVAHMKDGPAYRLYSVYQLSIAFGMLFNLLVVDRVGLSPTGKYYLIGSLSPVLSVPYGIASLRSQPSAPRIIQHIPTFIGIPVLKIPLEQREMLCGDRPGGVSHDNPPMHFGRASLTFEEVTSAN